MRSRFTLASDTKPFIASHYSMMSIPSMQKAVCVSNGLEFYVFDIPTRVVVSEVLDNFDFRKYYTYQIQSGLYSNLQKYVDATSHMSNKITANQTECHVDLSLHEFLAFGHLCSGGLL